MTHTIGAPGSYQRELSTLDEMVKQEKYKDIEKPYLHTDIILQCEVVRSAGQKIGLSATRMHRDFLEIISNN